jgi:two-component system, NarL family, sensor histidine kinase BarA
MASNVLNRIFGETKLELKLLLLFGAALLVIIVSAFWWYGVETNKLVYEQNQNTGGLLVDLYMLTLHWGVMDKLEDKRLTFVPSTPEEEHARQAQTDRWVDEMTHKLTRQKFTPELIRPGRKEGVGAPHDDFERELCQKFLGSPPPRDEETAAEVNPEHRDRFLPDGKGGQLYQYYEPIRAQASCLTVCHGPPLGGSGIDAAGTGISLAGVASAPLQKGDVMAVAKVTIPIVKKTQNKLYENWATLWAIAISTVFLGLLTSYAIVRYVIVKPVRHLRDVSDAVTRGNTALRAEIRTGDEFEQLATAFNRMLRTLITIQEELRQANANLDGKVDELAQVNMRLYEMNQLKSDFLATMSHELRTPLNSILGFSEVLAGIESMDDRQKRYVQNIQKSGKTLLEMINDILDLAKMESGRMEVRLTEFRVQQILAAQADLARPLAERKNIDLEVDCDPDLPPLRQDHARVQQILGNLLSNAVKFTPEGGRVTISAAREADELVMRIIDTGVGIAEEDQQVIFEKFRQGKMSVPTGDIMAREYSGSGLGLSIVKELCKLLGGQVTVASELGKGSTFTVRLPWTLSEAARPGAPAVDDLEQLATAR